MVLEMTSKMLCYVIFEMILLSFDAILMRRAFYLVFYEAIGAFKKPPDRPGAPVISPSAAKMAVLAASWGRLGVILGPLGALSGPSLDSLKSSLSQEAPQEVSTYPQEAATWS